MYQFRTIYDPDMPDKMPLALVAEKLRAMAASTVVKAVSILLYFICLVIQVPIFWKTVGRIYTWAIDGALPPGEVNFADALLLGGGVDLAGDPAKVALIKMGRFFNNTYFSGFRYIVVYIVVHLALFVEHEWVVRDESYSKLLMKKIGKEPRAKLVDMLHNALDGLRHDSENGNQQAGETLNRLEMLARAINDIQEDANHDRENDPETEALAEIERQHNNLNADNSRTEDAAEAPQPRAEQNGQTDDEANEQTDLNEAPALLRPTSEDEDATAPLQRPVEVPQPPHALPNVAFNQPEEPDNNDDEDEEDNDTVNQPEDALLRDEDLAEELQQQEDNADIFEVLGLSLNVSTPLLLMIICDTVIVIYLFLTYLIPHILGNTFLAAVSVSLKVASELLHAACSERLNRISLPKVPITNQTLKLVIANVHDLTIGPVTTTFSHLLVEAPPQLSLIERTIVLLLGYSLIIFAIQQAMKKLSGTKKPILGTARSIYKVLFEATATLKVFLIFAIEIFLFPVYCGWLLDMCASPLFLSTFVVDGKFSILFTSSSTILSINYIRVVIYWALGTLYMLFFALFIGMIRSKILRPGVLYFIRSPDDPNARLIHDALVKPFTLQLSRIFLSAKVYTAFVLLGIGSVTWGLRFLVSYDQTENTLLPCVIFDYSHLILVLALCGEIVRLKSVLSYYLRVYWGHAFALSCHKVRLSHFILGKPIPQERGYILYRSLLDSWFSSEMPDYSNPVSYREALSLFEVNKDINCYFIPDGGYIRVPDNDTVSRAFAKQLFVAVTKDGQLLEDINNNTSQDDDESDDEMNSDNSYTIVYRPPKWKLNCFQLIILLWVFAILLIVGCVFVSSMLGRPLIKAFTIIASVGFSALSSRNGFSAVLKDLQRDINTYPWRLLDVGSVAIGLLIGIHILNFYYKSGQEDGGNAVGDDQQRFGLNFGIWRANQEENDAPEQAQANNGQNQNLNVVQALVFPTLFLMLLTFNTIWEILVHKFVIDIPFRILYGYNLSSTPEDFLATKSMVLAHVLVFFTAVNPLIKSINHLLKARDIHRMPVRQMLVYSGVARMLVRILFVVVPSGLWVWRKSALDKLHPNDLLAFPLCYVLFYVGELLRKLMALLEKVNEQVKNEKYVRGRALENYEA